MINIKTILVPTDMSEHSLAAVDYATSIGLLYSAHILLLHVTDVMAVVFGLTDARTATEVRDQAEEKARAGLENFARKRFNQYTRITPVIRTGIAADEIVEYAQQENVDLIVMATHGRTGLQHILLGSVAERVVRKSSVPVLTVKPAELRSGDIETEEVESDLHVR